MSTDRSLGPDPLVSVVIPNFNNSTFLSDCIESVLKQSYRPIEIVVVDDGSTDNSLQVIRHIRSLTDVDFAIFANSHLGASVARNTGIMNSNGDLIAFLDSDDTWVPEKLEEQVSFLLEQDLDLVYSGGVEFSMDRPKGARFQPEFQGSCYKYFIKYPGKAIFVLGSSSVILRREILSQSGLFDSCFKDFAEDWDFFRRVSRFASAGYVDLDLVNYRRHSSNVSNSSKIKHFNSNWKAVTKMFLEDRDIKLGLKISIRVMSIIRFFRSVLP